MIPDKKSIPELFEKREQYLIPLFQRGYVWTLEQQIQLLWEDIIDRVDALALHRDHAKQVGVDKLKKLRKHFLGAIVVGPLVETDGSAIGTREVIDGQQRITTLQIMLLAFRDIAKALGDEGLIDDIGLLCWNKSSYQRKSDHFKVWPTNEGRDVMQSLVELGSMDAVCTRYPAWRWVSEDEKKWEWIERPAMVQAYLFFSAMIACQLRGKRFDAQLSGNEDDEGKTVAHSVIAAIRKKNELVIPFGDTQVDPPAAKLIMDALGHCFQLMQLRLDEEDDPQIIFETLNARGAPLTPSDLIRNFVFLRAARNQENVDVLYDTHWRGFDEKPDEAAVAKGAKFWRKEERQGRLKSARLDLLMYHYTTLRRVETLKVAHVFEEFKDWWDETPRDTGTELARLAVMAGHFERFLVPDQKTEFGRFCRRLKLLDTSTPTPLLLYLLEHHASNSAAFSQIMGDIDSYLVRRFVCGWTTKSYNKTFLNKLLAELVAEGTTDPNILRAKLLALDGESQAWPRDDVFADAWTHRQLYQGASTRKVRSILEGLELAMRSSKQEFLPEFDPLSVEHVLPQGWEAADYPLHEDTAEARDTRRRLLHSIGNLTLVTPGYNSTLSNRAFAEKRPEIAANSSLMLNSYFQGLSDHDVWDEAALQKRAKGLLPLALQLWRCPASNG